MKIKNIIWMFVLICLAFSSFGDYFPSSYLIETGNYNVGNLSDVQCDDTNFLHVDEVGGMPGFNVYFNFTNVTDFISLESTFFYDSLSSHIVDIRIYNYNTSTWDLVHQFTSSLEIQTDTDDILSVNHIQNGVVQIQFFHSDSGNAAHEIKFYCLKLVEEIESVVVACPTTELAWRNTILLLVVVCLIIGFGMYIDQMLFCILGSIGLMLWSLKIMDCDQTIASILFVCSLILGLYFGFREKKE